MNICHIVCPDIRARLPESPGCYWLVACQNVYGTGEPVVKPVPRMTNPDPFGVLYIGKAGRSNNGILEGTIRDRAGYELSLNLVKGRTAGHVPTYDYAHSDMVLRDMYPLDQLAIAWIEMSTAEEADDLEAVSLYRYRNTFGELPPFNRALPEKPLFKYGYESTVGGGSGRFNVGAGSYVPWFVSAADSPFGGW